MIIIEKDSVGIIGSQGESFGAGHGDGKHDSWPSVFEFGGRTGDGYGNGNGYGDGEGCGDGDDDGTGDSKKSRLLYIE